METGDQTEVLGFRPGQLRAPRAPTSPGSPGPEREGPAGRARPGASASETTRSYSPGSGSSRGQAADVDDEDDLGGRQALVETATRLIMTASKLATIAAARIARRRGRELELNFAMTSAEAGKLARPIVRVLSRRFQIRGVARAAGAPGPGAPPRARGRPKGGPRPLAGPGGEPVTRQTPAAPGAEERRRAWQERQREEADATEARARAAWAAEAERRREAESARQRAQEANLEAARSAEAGRSAEGLDYFAGFEDV